MIGIDCLKSVRRKISPLLYDRVTLSIDYNSASRTWHWRRYIKYIGFKFYLNVQTNLCVAGA